MASAPAPPALLSASPSSVHFSGFQLGRTYQQRVSVRNDSGRSLRLQFSFPGRDGRAPSAAFRVALAQDGAARKPFVSPGLTQELVVSFCAPEGFQYYYDCVRVRGEQVAYASSAPAALAGELLLPLHAYPAANALRDLPTRLDFGAVPLGQVARREIPLRCAVPVEFEFAVELAKAHPSFSVFPLSGVIPADGVARVEVEFRPLAYCTASAELRLLVSQLGFEPVRCSLVGSSTSTAGRGTSRGGADGDGGGGGGDGDGGKGSDGASPGRTDRRNRSDGGAPTASSQSKALPLSPTRRAGRDSTPSRKALGHRDHERGEEPPETVDGVEIPRDVDSVSGVAFVLNQQAGKLRPRNLKKAIAASRELRQQQALDLEADADNNPEDDGALTFSALVQYETENSSDRGGNNDVEAVVGRLRFQREVDAVAAREKALEFQSHLQSRVGAPLLTKAQAAALAEMRAMNALARARAAREAMRSAFDSVAFGLDSPKAAPLGTKTATLPAELASGAARALAVAPPDFKPHKNDLWARRARVLQRLVRAVSTVMVRVRVQRRLDQLKRWLGKSASRADVRARVALDWEKARCGDNQLEHEDGGDSGASSSSGGDGRVLYLSSVAEVERGEFRSRERSPVATADVGIALKSLAPPGLPAFFPLRERDEALAMGHAPMPLPPLPTYVPLFDVADADSGDHAGARQQRRSDASRPVRTLRAGAFDEYGSALRTLSEADKAVEAAAASVPGVSLLELLPRDVFLRPQAAVRPLTVSDRDPSVSALNCRPRESDPGFALRPTRSVTAPEARTVGERRAQQVGMASVAAERRWRRLGVCADGSGKAEGEAASPSLLLSDAWLPTSTARSMGTGVDPLFWFGDAAPAGASELFRDVWDVGIGRTDWGIPAFATAAEDVPPLSDSESDDGSEDGEETQTGGTGGGDKRRIPTWEDALRLFEPDRDCEERDEGREAAVFDRYDHLEQQERDYCAARRELLERLPKRLAPLAERLAQVPGAPELVVEGHGPQRPLHEAGGATNTAGASRVAVT